MTPRQIAPGDPLLIRATATDVTAAQLSQGENAWQRVGSGDVVGMEEQGPYVTIPYTNWRGEFGLRQIAPIRLYWGSNEWHPEPQWLIEAWDPQKVSVRTFALSGIGTAATLIANQPAAPVVATKPIRMGAVITPAPFEIEDDAR